MSYTIEILKKKILEHQKEIDSLIKIRDNPELQIDVLFSNEEIINQQVCISQLQEDIKILLKHGY